MYSVGLRICKSFLLVLMSVTISVADPIQGVIEGGDAVISSPDADTTLVDQYSDRAILGTSRFNINADESFIVRQPGSHSILWVKDYQQGPSQIHGTIQANGQVWISNRFGHLVGKMGKIDTAGTILTSSSMRNQDFLVGQNDFSIAGNPNAFIANEGLITAREGGLVGIVAPGVANDGIIYARLGRVTLAAGNRFTVDVRSDGLFRFAPDDEIIQQVIDHRTGKPVKHLVSNNGLIEAPGGLIAISAVNTRLLLDSVIDNSGRVLAPTYEKTVGRVKFSTALPSQQRAAQKKTQKPKPRQKVTISGKIDVSGHGENQTGGEILILGEVLGLNKANLDASGTDGGGLVFIGGDYLGGNVSEAERNRLNLRDPSQVLSSTTETIMQDTTITADALESGRGGQVVVRADDRAAISGEISVRGDRGIIDTSGENQLVLDVDVDVSNPNGGKAGSWTIDPGDIAVEEVAAAIDFTNPFAAAGATTIAAGDIETTLNAGGDVLIVTDGGRIDVNTDIQKTSGDESALTFQSTTGFLLAIGKKIERVLTGTFDVDKHDLNVVIDGNTDQDGTGTTTINGNIITRGGDVDIRGQRIVLETGAVQTLNDPEGNDGDVSIIAQVTAGFPAWAVIGLNRQAINAGNGDVTVEATSSATDDTISYGNEAIITTGQITTTSDRHEANPGNAPHLLIGSTSPNPVINGTQVQPIVVARTNTYTPQTPPGPNTAPTATSAGVVFAYTAGQAFSFTTPANMFSDDGGVANLTLTVINLQSWMTFVDNGDGTATISGTPPDTNAYRPTIVATDAGGLSVQKDVRFELGTITPPTTPTSNPPTRVSSSSVILLTATVINGNSFSIDTGPLFSDDGGTGNLQIEVEQVSSDYPGAISIFQTIRHPDASVTFRQSVVVLSINHSGNVIIRLTAVDADNQRISQLVNLRIELPTSPPPTPMVDNPPTASGLSTFTQTASIFGDVSLAVSRNYFADDNGTSNLNLSLRSGFSPPDGTRVSISRDGTLVVSGTIRRPGTYYVPVEATDHSGQSVARTFIIVFDPSGYTPVGNQPNDDANVAPVPPPQRQPVNDPTRRPDPILEFVDGRDHDEVLAEVFPTEEGLVEDRFEVVEAGQPDFDIPVPPETSYTPIPDSYPPAVKSYISQNMELWNQIAPSQPFLENFQYYIDQYGSDATVQFIYDYKRFFEGKSATRAAVETIGNDAFRDSGIAADLKTFLREEGKFLTELGIGFTPAGIALDGRDLSVAYQNGDPVGLFIAGVGFVPVIGDAFKYGSKTYRLSRETAGNVDDVIKINIVEDVPPGIAPNTTFVFSASGSGTHLTRTASIDGIDIRINSGHAYYRTHSGGDVSQIGTMDEIETAILNDISSNSKLNGLTGTGNQHTILVNGQTIIYELSDTPIGPVLSNYYPPNP